MLILHGFCTFFIRMLHSGKEADPRSDFIEQALPTKFPTLLVQNEQNKFSKTIGPSGDRTQDLTYSNALLTELSCHLVDSLNL